MSMLYIFLKFGIQSGCWNVALMAMVAILKVHVRLGCLFVCLIESFLVFLVSGAQPETEMKFSICYGKNQWLHSTLLFFALFLREMLGIWILWSNSFRFGCRCRLSPLQCEVKLNFANNEFIL